MMIAWALAIIAVLIVLGFCGDRWRARRYAFESAEILRQTEDMVLRLQGTADRITQAASDLSAMQVPSPEGVFETRTVPAVSPRPELVRGIVSAESENSWKEAWSAMPEVGEVAGLTCALMAAREFERLLELTEHRLYYYVHEWRREVLKGRPETSRVFLRMSKEAWFELQRGISGWYDLYYAMFPIEVLMRHWRFLEALPEDFRKGVIEQLSQTTGNIQDRQEHAAATVSRLLSEISRARQEIGDWRVSARQDVILRGQAYAFAGV